MATIRSLIPEYITALSGVSINSNEANYLAGTIAGSIVPNKCVVTDASNNIVGISTLLAANITTSSITVTAISDSYFTLNSGIATGLTTTGVVFNGNISGSSILSTVTNESNKVANTGATLTYITNTLANSPNLGVAGINRNLRIWKAVGNTDVSITVDEINLGNTNEEIKRVRNISILDTTLSTLATATTGGLDTGTWQASNWYHLYLATNGAQVVLLSSLATDISTLSNSNFAWTYAAHVGSVRSVTLSTIYNFEQFGNYVYYKENILFRSTLTITAVYTWTDVNTYMTGESITDFIPFNASNYSIYLGSTHFPKGLSGHPAGYGANMESLPWDFTNMVEVAGLSPVSRAYWQYFPKIINTGSLYYWGINNPTDIAIIIRGYKLK